MSSTTHPPAGYYPDPNTQQPRWWDGNHWGPATPAAPPVIQVAPANEYQGGLVAGGYIFAVLLPFIGFILGIVVATRQSRATSKHGIWIIVLSTAVFFLGLAYISGSFDSSTSSYSSY